MKALLCAVLSLAAGVTHAATTINPANRFSYGANIGWMDWRGDGINGAVIGEFLCSGFVYAANAGWINLGSGVAANGVRYQNNSAADFGVNHDGLGNLHGYAYGANIGWLTFTNRDVNGVPFEGPKLDLFTGKLSGFIWSANCGWISLSNIQAFVQTDRLPTSADSDGDGIPDAWELAEFGNLTTANATSDYDHDGFSDKSECLADTDPLDPSSLLRITNLMAANLGASNTLTWTSTPTRQYRVWQTNDLSGSSSWIEVGLGLVLPDPGPTTTRAAIQGPSAQRFYRVEAVKPLSP